MQIHIVVSGIVQSVNYRRYTKDLANKLGVAGSVRNMQDGSVEIYADQSEDILKQFLLSLKRGPPLAVVKNIKAKKIEGFRFNGFEIV